jgi:tRNA threonylcarbamoyladenosine biosynthesis protein TsaB
MFRILALETSKLTGSVAAAADGKVLAELQLDPQQRSAQSLAPAIRTLLRQVGWQPREIRLLAVTVGPGSFTGLRVGVATAKVFAYAAGAEVLGISTLEAIAAATPDGVAAVSVAVDAQRGDVVAQPFRRAPQASAPAGWLEAAGDQALVPLGEWLARLPSGFAVSGPVLKKWTDPRPGVPGAPAGVTMLDRAFWRPTAGNVARLAYRDYLAGRRDDLWNLLPRYSRPSAAEEKLATKTGN